MWKELGWNYNYLGSAADYETDLQFLKDAGVKYIRLLLPDFRFPEILAAWKPVCLFALSLEFEEVTFGHSNGAYTSSNMAAFNTARESLAQWCEDQNNPALTFITGNEEMFHRDGSLTDAQVRTNETTEYGVLRDIYTVGKMTYTMANGEMFVFYNDGDWPAKDDANGYVSANLYSYAAPLANGATYFKQNIANGQGWFGAGNFHIHEFGPDPNGYVPATWKSERMYELQFLQNLEEIIRAGVPRAYAYNFLGEPWGALRQKAPGQRSFKPWWYSLQGLKKPITIEYI